MTQLDDVGTISLLRRAPFPLVGVTVGREVLRPCVVNAGTWFTLLVRLYTTERRGYVGM